MLENMKEITGSEYYRKIIGNSHYAFPVPFVKKKYLDKQKPKYRMAVDYH